jgi:DNA polymerase sigma
MSDIDICLNYIGKSNIEIIDITEIMNILVSNFSTENKIFESVNPIYTASVPVLKLQIDIESFLGNCELIEIYSKKRERLNYSFNPLDFKKIKIDITFLDVKNRSNDDKPNTEKAVEFIKDTLIDFPEIKPIIQLTKRILHILNLNTSYNGGASSFTLFLMIFAFLKFRKCNNIMNFNLGKLLIDFFEFYGYFDFNSYIINVNYIK